jgi:8-oxo-dGTP diphosphatase
MIISTAGIALKDNTFLLALRKPGTSIGESWEFPGGKGEYGETPEEALKREFWEELNIQIEVGKRICDGTFRNNEKVFEIYGFIIQLLTEDFTLIEHSRIGWFSLDEMASLKMAGSDKQIVNKLKQIYI